MCQLLSTKFSTPKTYNNKKQWQRQRVQRQINYIETCGRAVIPRRRRAPGGRTTTCAGVFLLCYVMQAQEVGRIQAGPENARWKVAWMPRFVLVTPHAICKQDEEDAHEGGI